MIEGYVSAAVCSSEVDAKLAQATLAASGIESYLKFEDTGGMMPVLQHAEGVQVLVDPKDLEEAKTVLSSSAGEIEPE